MKIVHEPDVFTELEYNSDQVQKQYLENRYEPSSKDLVEARHRLKKKQKKIMSDNLENVSSNFDEIHEQYSKASYEETIDEHCDGTQLEQKSHNKRKCHSHNLIQENICDDHVKNAVTKLKKRKLYSKEPSLFTDVYVEQLEDESDNMKRKQTRYNLNNPVLKAAGKSNDQSKELSPKEVQHCSENVLCDSQMHFNDEAATTQMKHLSHLEQSTTRNKTSAEMNDERELYTTDSVPYLDLIDIPLKFIPPELHKTGCVTPLTVQQKQDLKSKGVIIRTGKWHHKEDLILERNWNKFVKKFKISDPVLLLGIHQGIKNKELHQFITAKKFYQRLGKDLNDRTLYSIYARARNILNPFKLGRRLEPEEIESILRLHLRYGNKWTKIGEILNLDAKTCSEVIRWHGKKIARGPWTLEEDELLIQALQNTLNTDDLHSVTHGVPWDKISFQVPSRNGSQCKKRWLNALCWKINNNTPKMKWTKKHSACLIYLLYHEPAESESTVDWNSLSEIFNRVSPSYMYLRSKFMKLRCRVPNYDKKEYEDVITHLYHFHLPPMLNELSLTHEDLQECLRQDNL